MTKPRSRKAKNPRKPVFDRALEEATKKLERAQQKQKKAQETLAWAANEIPRLQRIIDAFTGGPISDGTNYAVMYRNSETGLETPLSPEHVMEKMGLKRKTSGAGVELLPDANVVQTADDNRFLPDVE